MRILLTATRPSCASNVHVERWVAQDAVAVLAAIAGERAAA